MLIFFAAPTKIDSRGKPHYVHDDVFEFLTLFVGVTRGTWRGVNQLYDFNIPSGVLVAGSNTIQINVISGSSGSQFLSPNFVYDSVELF